MATATKAPKATKIAAPADTGASVKTAPAALPSEPAQTAQPPAEVLDPRPIATLCPTPLAKALEEDMGNLPGIVAAWAVAATRPLAVSDKIRDRIASAGLTLKVNKPKAGEPGPRLSIDGHTPRSLSTMATMLRRYARANGGAVWSAAASFNVHADGRPLNLASACGDRATGIVRELA